MPSPTDIEETFVSNFVGDGFLHVPKRYQYININSANKPFQTARTIINPERSDPQLLIVNCNYTIFKIKVKDCRKLSEKFNDTYA